jgi:preprotein translocase subunit SecA
MTAKQPTGTGPTPTSQSGFIAKPNRFSRQQIKMLTQIESHRAKLKALSPQQLTNGFNDLRVKVHSSQRDLEELAHQAMAFAKEATSRVLGMELYDVQLLAGNALVNQKIAEMQTGEGKTISAIPGAVHGGMFGAGVHVATPNGYLAERDFQQNREVYVALGLSVGLLPTGEGPTDPVHARAAYDSDITYGTGYEFGFDYLRDQLILKQEKQLPFGQKTLALLHGNPGKQLAQRGLGFSIVDEADNVLIDDATSPQVLSEFQSGTAPDSDAIQLARSIALNLERGQHYHEPMPSALELTRQGEARIYEADVPIPTRQLIRPWKAYVEAALRAEHHFLRNIQYVVSDEGVRIVDESTGRIFEDRSWQAGLHQAVEAKEGMPISPESIPLATITRQRFYRLYKGLSGMTGTTQGCIRELKTIFNLGVERIPLRKPSQRVVLPTRVFANADRKWNEITRNIIRLQSEGRPVLIGTRTIQESQLLAERLDSTGLSYQLLNGTQDSDEADLVSRAGHAGAITIATNLAGRGTDIKLPPPVAESGGLHVIVSECHASSRVDRQLVGRCARQGQKGSCQTFISAEDWLLRTHASWLSESITRLASDGELSMDLDRKILELQNRLEREQFAVRLLLLRTHEQRNEIILGTRS